MKRPAAGTGALKVLLRICNRRTKLAIGIRKHGGFIYKNQSPIDRAQILANRQSRRFFMSPQALHDIAENFAF